MATNQIQSLGLSSPSPSETSYHTARALESMKSVGKSEHFPSHCKQEAQECFNCKVTQTPLWRRSPDGKHICNACGIYWKTHNKHRPVEWKATTIKRRRRYINGEYENAPSSLSSSYRVSSPSVGMSSPPKSPLNSQYVNVDHRKNLPTHVATMLHQRFPNQDHPQHHRRAQSSSSGHGHAHHQRVRSIHSSFSPWPHTRRLPSIFQYTPARNSPAQTQRTQFRRESHSAASKPVQRALAVPRPHSAPSFEFRPSSQDPRLPSLESVLQDLVAGLSRTRMAETRAKVSVEKKISSIYSILN